MQELEAREVDAGRSDPDGVAVYLRSLRRLAREEARKQPADGARQRCPVAENVGLAVHFARKFRGRGLDLEDLITEAVLGLIRAVRDYRPELGRFSTYAGIVIQGCLCRALYETGRVVRLPIAAHARIRAIHKAEAVLRNELSREPSAAEVAERLGLSAGQIERAIIAARPVASMDAPLVEGGEDLANYLPAPVSPQTLDGGEDWGAGLAGAITAAQGCGRVRICLNKNA